MNSWTHEEVEEYTLRAAGDRVLADYGAALSLRNFNVISYYACDLDFGDLSARSCRECLESIRIIERNNYA